MTREERLIAEYRARGGRITRCPGPDGIGNRPPQPYGWIKDGRSVEPAYRFYKSWKPVDIASSRIAEAETWLRSREAVFRTQIGKRGDAYRVRLQDAKLAVLFKLTFGGQ